jgi:hypothetical protein
MSHSLYNLGAGSARREEEVASSQYPVASRRNENRAGGTFVPTGSFICHYFLEVLAVWVLTGSAIAPLAMAAWGMVTEVSTRRAIS